jgi:hypothetical protein
MMSYGSKGKKASSYATKPKKFSSEAKKPAAKTNKVEARKTALSKMTGGY